MEKVSWIMRRIKENLLAFIRRSLRHLKKKKTVSKREDLSQRSIHLIGTGWYCPDCGGLCGNDKHDRRW